MSIHVSNREEPTLYRTLCKCHGPVISSWLYAATKVSRKREAILVKEMTTG